MQPLQMKFRERRFPFFRSRPLFLLLLSLIAAFFGCGGAAAASAAKTGTPSTSSSSPSSSAAATSSTSRGTNVVVRRIDDAHPSIGRPPRYGRRRQKRLRRSRIPWLFAAPDGYAYGASDIFDRDFDNEYEHNSLPRLIALVRGGGFFRNRNRNNEGGGQSAAGPSAVEDYVAAKDEHDRRNGSASHLEDDVAGNQDAGQGRDSDGAAPSQAATEDGGDANSSSSGAPPSPEETPDAAAVGVKSHPTTKSNAVGDPDGDGSDDDDDDDESEERTDISEEEEWEEQVLLDPTTQVQLEVEFVEDPVAEEDGGRGVRNDEDAAASAVGGGGGGVGVRALGQRFATNSRRKKNKDRDSQGNKEEWRSKANPKIWQTNLLEAWRPHVYMPPKDAAIAYLADRARSLDGASKSRLDRRTLYAGLLLEWLHAASSGSSSSSSGTDSFRKYLDAPTSQALQSALSMATQPQWRKSFPRHNGVRLYDGDRDQNVNGGQQQQQQQPNAYRGCTLAMQETIAMAMVREKT